MTMLPDKSKFDNYVKMGLIRSQTTGELTIYQYTELTQFDRLWNSVTLNARGIVFDSKGRLIQRCMPKFFNSDEPNGIIDKLLNKASEPIVQSKEDGSLIKVTYDNEYGLIVTSKASFNTKQSNWAMEIIKEKGYVFLPGNTYHFELIHPENQIVLNYKNKKALILLCIIKNDNGEEYNIYDKKISEQFEVVSKLPIEVLQDINKLNEHSLHEGVVVNYGSYRLKMKTEEYVRVHRIVTDLTTKRVWEALSQGQSIDRYNIPEEFQNWLDATETNLKDEYNHLLFEITEEDKKSSDMSNKEIGLSEMKYKSYIFALRSSKDISEMIWKAIKPKAEE